MPVNAEKTEQAELLEELEAKAQETHSSTERPDSLPLGSIIVLPKLFQPRGTTSGEKHIHDLAKVIQKGALLDAILVAHIGDEIYLIDGHHRIEAYIMAEFTEGVPVVYFEGTPKEAVLEAGRANYKPKMPMSNDERNDYAWQLVLLGKYSKKETSEASGVSLRQVSNMRATKVALKDLATECRSWVSARMKLKNIEEREWTDVEREEWMEQKAENLADRMVTTFGKELANKPEIAARVLEMYMGRRLGELYSELTQLLGDIDSETGEETFF